MDSVDDAPQSGAPAGESPARSGRPEHSILSLALLFALSVGALYLVDWALRDDGTVVQAWDFTKPLDSPWEFPDPNAIQDEAGMTFEMTASGYGPKIELDLPAASVNRIQATVSAMDTKTGKPVHFGLGWYWARESDVEAAPDAPLATNRAMAFYTFARHRPNTYRADVNTHDAWDGTIKSGLFTLKFPADANGPFRVTLSRIEFLE